MGPPSTWEFGAALEAGATTGRESQKDQAHCNRTTSPLSTPERAVALKLAVTPIPQPQHNLRFRQEDTGPGASAGLLGYPALPQVPWPVCSSKPQSPILQTQALEWTMSRVPARCPIPWALIESIPGKATWAERNGQWGMQTAHRKPHEAGRTTDFVSK